MKRIFLFISLFLALPMAFQCTDEDPVEAYLKQTEAQFCKSGEEGADDIDVDKD